ncbi:MAG: hypothetical protein M3Q09_07305 [Gemmatimonadota bacterium]|nr:hypothetical protein [Gemmatimonadota bacterium]
MRDFIARQNSERLRKRLSNSIRIREPAAFSKLARSTVDIALVTGVVARLYRALILTRLAEGSAAYIALLGVGAIFVLTMATVHLSRFPLRQWLTRAPLFAALEGTFEMLASLGLIALHREPVGTTAAEFGDWPEMAARTVLWRTVTISIFAAMLAAVVKWVRYLFLRREHSASAAGTVNSGVPGEKPVDRRRPGASKARFPDETLADRRRRP